MEDYDFDEELDTLADYYKAYGRQELVEKLKMATYVNSKYLKMLSVGLKCRKDLEVVVDAIIHYADVTRKQPTPCEVCGQMNCDGFCEGSIAKVNYLQSLYEQDIPLWEDEI